MIKLFIIIFSLVIFVLSIYELCKAFMALGVDELKPRPDIKDYFPEGTTPQDIQQIFIKNKELYAYIGALDDHIDYLES